MARKKRTKDPLKIDEEFKVGEIIKRLREANRWSRRQLAKLAGISPAAIYKIENNQMIPTITTVIKIARAFRKNLQELILPSVSDSNYSVTRKKDRLKVSTQEFPVNVERISGELAGRKLEAGILTVRAGATVSQKPMSHEGEEIHLIMKGEITYTIGKETFTLKSGDSIHFFSRTPHTWKNTGKTDAKVLVIATPSPFV